MNNKLHAYTIRGLSTQGLGAGPSAEAA